MSARMVTLTYTKCDVCGELAYYGSLPAAEGARLAEDFRMIDGARWACAECYRLGAERKES